MTKENDPLEKLLISEEEFQKIQKKNLEIPDGAVRIYYSENSSHKQLILGDWIKKKIDDRRADLYFKDDQIAVAFNPNGDYAISKNKQICINKLLKEMNISEIEGDFKAEFEENLDVLFVDLTEEVER